MHTRVALLLALAAAAAHGQTVSAQRLAAPNGRLSAEFTSVTSIRELADGRLLIADVREQRLVVGDFRTGAVTQVGRAGNGPGEFRVTPFLHALPGDTTILPTTGFRWIVFVGSGIEATLGPERTQAFSVRGTMVALAEGGSVVSRVGSPASCHETETTRPDTVYVVRSSRLRRQADTLAHLLVAPTTRRRRGTAQRCTPPVLPLNDDLAVFSDGSIAIARQRPYRVDWIAASGARTQGSPLGVDLPPVTERDRKAIVDMSPSRPRRMPEFDFDRFPDRAPAFQAGAVIAAPDGRVLIQRTVLASSTEARYDIVDRMSRLAGILIMDRTSRIAGFGRASVYVVTTDADGLQRIARHPWP